MTVSNDDIADALPLILGVEATVDVSTATTTPDEDTYIGGYRSVWYTIAPDHDMYLAFDTLSQTGTGTAYWALVPPTGLADATDTWLTTFADGYYAHLTGGLTYHVTLYSDDPGATSITFLPREYAYGWGDWIQPPDLHTSAAVDSTDTFLYEDGSTTSTSSYSIDGDQGTNSSAIVSALNATSRDAFDQLPSLTDDSWLTSPTTGAGGSSGSAVAYSELKVSGDTTYTAPPVGPATFVRGSTHYTMWGLYFRYAAPGSYTDTSTTQYESTSAELVSAHIGLRVSATKYQDTSIIDVLSTECYGQVEAYWKSANNAHLEHPYSNADVGVPFGPFPLDSSSGGGGPDVHDVDFDLAASALTPIASPQGITVYTRLSGYRSPTFIGFTPGGSSDPVTYTVTVAANSPYWVHRPPRYRNLTLLPVTTATATVPPLRLTNRVDAFASALSLTRPDTSMQGGNRLTGYL